jgi:hypothetical protein
MADPSGDRLTAVTADNHQPWLWFLQVFSCACIAGAGGLRFWIKRKHFRNSDVILLIAHVRLFGPEYSVRFGNESVLADHSPDLGSIYILLDHSTVRVTQWPGEVG